VEVHWHTLQPADVRNGVTAPLRTVLDCAATLPFAEALAIADGALRLALVTPEALLAAARRWRGRGARDIRRVAMLADARAAGPFESGLRSIALDAGCTGFEPQVTITVPGGARVDLADVERRIVLEADSFEWHGNRQALHRDCRRYDELVRAGWTVLRFAWEDVMFDAAWVQEVIKDVVATRPPGRKENRRPNPAKAAS
jgi:very-short-patch-repair endonuclease